MAGAEFKITDAIDGNIFIKLNELTKLLKSLDKDFSATSESYASFAKDLANKINSNPETLAELDKKTKDYEKTVKSLHDNQSKLSDLQQKYKEMLKQVNEMTKQAVMNAQKDAKAKSLNADAELKLEKAQTERLRQQKLLNGEQSKQKITIEQAIELTKEQVHSIAEAEAQNKRLRQSVKEITDAEDKDGKIRRQLNSVIDQNTNYIKRNRDALVRNKMTVGDYKEQVKLAMIELRNGSNTLENFGVVAKGFGGILRTSVANGASQVASSVGTMIKGFIGAQAIIGVIQSLIGAFKQGVRTAIDFEAANSKLAAILGTTKKNIKDLTSDARRLGEVTKYTASEVTNLQIELSKLGFSKNDILDMTEGILKFSQATGSDLPEAAALAGASLRMFGADTKETERYVSAMAVATTKSALSFSYLQTAMPIVGPVAKSFNFTIEDTLALLGKLADAGFDASSSATATRNILLNLADGSGKLAKALGGPVKSLPELVDGLKKLKEEGIDLNKTLELTDKRSVAAFNSFLTAADKIMPLREQITGVSKDLDDMSNEMGNNVQGALNNMSSAWEALMLTIMRNTGAMKDFVDMATSGIRKLNEWIMSTDQLAEKQVEAAKRSAIPYAEESLKSETIALNRIKEQYIKAGDEETAALEKAKKERISILEQELSSQQSMRNKAYSDNQKLWKDMDNASFFKQALGLEKTNAEFSKEQTRTWNDYLDKVKKVASLEKQIAEISRMSTGKNPVNNGKKELTDKEIKDLEKARQEMLRIEKEYENSKLELMDDGLEKELAKIRLNYTQRIAAVKGNSEKENETRLNLADKMQQELASKEIDFYLAQEKKKTGLALASVKKNSEEELNLRLSLNDLEYEAEVNALNGNYENLNAIIAKFERKRADIEEQFASERIKRIQENAVLESTYRTAAFKKELDDIELLHAKGLMNDEEYNRRKLEISSKYAIEQAQASLDLINEQLLVNLPEDETLKLKQKQAEAEIALAEAVRDAEIDAVRQAADEQKKHLEKLAENIQMVGDILNALSGLGSAIFDAKIQKVEEEQEESEAAGEAEIARIEALEERGAISTEEAEARKRAAEDKTSKRNEELEKKKAALQTKQAKFEKANSIAQSMINTATGILKTIATVGFPAAIPLIAAVSAMGAIELATIIATPIPKYAKGTRDHKGGPAIVGDGGVSETILTDKGAYLTPSVPTLVDIPKGAQVIPFAIDMEKMKASANDLSGLMSYREENGLPPISIVNDYSELEREIKSLRKGQQSGFSRLAKAIKDNNYQQFSKDV